jgi:hypothetical protein
MSNKIIENEVDVLMKRYKDRSYSEQIELSLDHLNGKLKDQPLVVLFHEMKKELNIRKDKL